MGRKMSASSNVSCRFFQSKKNIVFSCLTRTYYFSPYCRGVAQAGAFCYGFFLLSRVVDDYFAHQDVPSQYTARNITLVIQSVGRGLVYLVTFIFGANATGLAALAIQLVVDPEGVDRGLDQPREKKDVLPRVKLTDDLGSIKRAFKEAENMGARDVKYKKK